MKVLSKAIFFLLISMLLFVACQEDKPIIKVKNKEAAKAISDSLHQKLNWPEDIHLDYFAGPEWTPSPACLAVSVTGDVFVGVDMIGSLGKEPGKGRIVKLIDANKDGLADTLTTFVTLDNPRGILPIGNKVYVLYTTFSETEEIASGMDLVVFEDVNQDGIADGPPQPLIQNISSPKFLQSRGTDHSTNGIRMGIDGWIYIAVGDFGFHDAVDRDGTKMTMLGGGIVRVRPDGTEMEVYTHGTRNIYDVAIDPFMNIYTRGNTNDGGGWDIRFLHHIQSGEYGYPTLFKHFTDEILPALADVGGGSGVGALYMDEPSWQAPYNKVPMMGDWGRNELFIHRVSKDGASFTQAQESFLKLPQITDVDVDGSGQVFISAWDGAGYRGNDSKGFIVRATPKNWKYQAFPDLASLSKPELINLLKSKSATTRLHAQQALLDRESENIAANVLEIAKESTQSLEARVAAIFTYAQLAKENGIDNLIDLAKDKHLKEFALRALADRKPWADKVPTAPFIEGLQENERVSIAAMVGLGRIGKSEVANELLKTKVPISAIAPAKGTIGLHAKPNSAIIPAHVAVQSLVKLNAVAACVNAIGGENSDLALWALRYMHDKKAVEGLIAAYEVNQSKEINAEQAKNLGKKIITTLSRLYKKEAPYDGSWWWSTRPDSRGPFYKGIKWEGSDLIEQFLTKIWEQSNPQGKAYLSELNGRHRMGIAQFGGEEEKTVKEDNRVNLGRIANKKGQVERASIEDVMLAMADIEGNPKIGTKLYKKQGCPVCHSIKPSEPLKGPYLGQIGAIMTRDQIAESILKPNASIAQGFPTMLIMAKEDKSYVGFVSEESADQLVITNIAGHVFTVKTADIISKEEVETSSMPLGLTNPLTFEEFTGLVDFLANLKN